MAVARNILARWHYPRRDVIDNEVFASGKPPFAPFPIVTNLLNSNLCPVAIYHELLHGENALMTSRDWVTIGGRGELFHNFIGYLKLSIRNGNFELRGDIPAMERAIQHRFYTFAQAKGHSSNKTDEIWQTDIQPWVNRKLRNQELQNINSDDHFFFELTLANHRINLPVDSGLRHYPLRGRIDEIDLTNRRLVERTIKPETDDSNPPLLKDYQIWLLWTILNSLTNDQLAPDLRNVNLNDFELVVETPFNDYIVEKNNDEFVTQTHWSYAWINDIGISETSGIFGEIFENAQCAPENPNDNCGHPFVNCFPTRYVYPESRPEIRRSFQPWFRYLLWEQMWKGHLWHYRMLMLNREELLDLGLILETRILTQNGRRTDNNNQIELELIENQARTLRGYDFCTIIPYGTVYCGLHLAAELSINQNNRIFLQTRSPFSELSEEAILLLSPDIPTPIVSEPPTFLQRKQQYELFRLRHIGSQSRDKASVRSVVQLLEGVFGTKNLRRGGR